jgi:hypothetical protein
MALAEPLSSIAIVFDSEDCFFAGPLKIWEPAAATPGNDIGSPEICAKGLRFLD